MEFRLLAAAVTAIAATAAVILVSSRGDRDRGRALIDVALGGVVAGVAFGRVASMVLAGTNPLSHPGDLLIVRGGVHTGVAAVAAIAASMLLARRVPRQPLAALAPAALVGLAAWHGGCLLRDACLGTPSSLPWAIAGPGGVGRHPVEVYAALLFVLAALALVALRRRYGPAPVVGTAIAFAALARLVTEPMRPVLGSSLVGLYALGVAAGTVVVVVTWLEQREPEPHP